MSALFKLAKAATLFASYAAALGPFKLSRPPNPVENLTAVLAQDGGITNATFQQLLDHDDPELGTFTQHYIFNADFWAGPGAPIIVTSSGESALEPYAGDAKNDSYLGLFAQKTGAAIVFMEHRYWGESSPYKELPTATMKYLTLRNSVADLTYFARNVVFPFDPNCTSTPDKAPWIFAGCSYAGALAAWTEALDPGTFWAYQASSAVVEAIEDFWQMGEIINQAMTPNCSADVIKTIDAIDDVLLGDNETAKHQLKDRFALADLKDDDFAQALANPAGAWQNTLFAGGDSTFFQWCDYVENQWPGSTEPVPGPEGVGVEKALAGYAKFTKEVYLPDACDRLGFSFGPNTTECFDTSNATSPMFTDLKPDNPLNRQWYWLLCNEPFEWWQDRGQNKIFSRLVTQKYNEKLCNLALPAGPDDFTFSLNRGSTVDQVNFLTGGWDHATTRVSWTVGEFDTWRGATVASTSRPGGPLASTPEHPVHIVPGASHCSDVYWKNYAANDGVRKVVDDEIQVLSQWIQEFYDEHGKEWPGRGY